MVSWDIMPGTESLLYLIIPVFHFPVLPYHACGQSAEWASSSSKLAGRQPAATSSRKIKEKPYCDFRLPPQYK